MTIEDLFEEILDIVYNNEDWSGIDYYNIYLLIIFLSNQKSIKSKKDLYYIVYNTALYITKDEDTSLDCLSIFIKKYKNKRIKYEY